VALRTTLNKVVSCSCSCFVIERTDQTLATYRTRTWVRNQGAMVWRKLYEKHGDRLLVHGHAHMRDVSVPEPRSGAATAVRAKIDYCKSGNLVKGWKL
jgi:calcineurin-like phosphoesterase family protein